MADYSKDIESINNEREGVKFLYESNKFNELLASSKPLLERINKLIKIINEVDTDKYEFEQIQELNNAIIILQSYRNEINILIYESNKESIKNEKYAELTKSIQEKEINQIMYDNRIEINDLVYKERSINEEINIFKVLRRWNSYTPLLNFDPTDNVGGGYFIAWKNTSVIIDPGINFIQNMLRNNISIADIDSIILTHSHVDHTSDFEGLMTLFFKYNEIRNDTSELAPKKIKLFITIGSMNKYSKLISLTYDNISEIIIIQPGKHYIISDKLIFTPTLCKHDDLFCEHPHSCVGIIFNDNDTGKPIIGLTSDTSFNDQVSNSFKNMKDCPLVLHIGGIESGEYDTSKPANEIVYKTHLGLKGLYNFIFDVKPKVVIVSEFGEEFKDARIKLVNTYKEIFPDTKLIPADMNLTLKFTDEDIMIHCDACGQEVDIEEIDFKTDVDSVTIQYMCSDCM